MPVAHGDEASRVQSLTSEFAFACARLPFGIRPDRRPYANGCVVVLDHPRASPCNQLCKRLGAKAGKREVNDIGIAEEVIKKRLDRFQRVGSAELKENYPYTPCCARHSPESPERTHSTPNPAYESMAELQKFLRNALHCCDHCKIDGAQGKLISMPELPDITAYLRALEVRVISQPLQKIRLGSPFLLRSVQPPLESAEGRKVTQLRRIGKRIAIGRS